jgi:peptide/nickel transport system substrate-binding protein
MQWREIGAAVDLVQAASFSALLEARAGGAYHLIAWNQAGTDPDLLRPFFRSDGAYNWSGIADDELDELLDAALRSGDDAGRLELYRRAQEVIARECAILPLRDYVNLNVAAGRVKGLRFSPHGWFPVLIDVELA